MRTLITCSGHLNIGRQTTQDGVIPPARSVCHDRKEHTRIDYEG